MNQNKNKTFLHRRASSDNAYNRQSSQKKEEMRLDEQVGRLNKQQQILLQNVKELMNVEGRLNKTERIRVAQWSQKLSCRPKNIVWRKNIIFYLEVLIQMINQQVITAPFSAIPNEGALPNLKLLDLPYPIREILMEKEKTINSSNNKKIAKEHSVETHKCKAKSINFDQDLQLNMEHINNTNIKFAKRTNKNSEIKSCQVRDAYKQKKFSLKFTAECNKENISLINSNAYITRRLFQNQIKNESNSNTLQTYKNSENAHHHNTTICSFQGHPSIKTNSNRGIELLTKVYEMIQNNSNLEDNIEAQSLCSDIKKMAEQRGIFLSNSSHNQSKFSQTSVSFRKASENMRLKFVETDEQTLEFMSFLQKIRVKNQ